MGDTARCGNCGGVIPADAPAGACPHCALAAALPPRPDPTPEEVAAKLPGFDILGILGRGGMGVVFKARQKALDRVVALKVLPPATAATPGFSERFVREAKAMARLQHPNIVAVHDFGEAGGLFYLVLEFVDGMNVREAMQAGRIGPAEALAIVPQICDALQYAHDRGVVHRDVKPENVLIDRDGRVKIADFGLAKLADREAGDLSLTGASQVMGTLHYMAPEQWERPKDVDHRCDIYSLGVVFYEMLTGELPVGKFEPPSHRAAIDVRIDAVVLRSLERDREQRWQRADEVKTKVSAISSSAPGAAAAAAAPAMASRAGESVPSEEDVVHIGLAAVILGALTVITAIAAFASDMGWMWWLVAGATFTAIACAAVWFSYRRRRDAADPAAARRADERERQREEEAQEATFTNAASAWLVAIAFGVGAVASGEDGLWWPAGTIAFGAAVVTVQAIEKRAKLAPPAQRVARAEGPAAPWLSPRMCGFAAAGGVVLIAALIWCTHTGDHETSNAVGILAVVLALLMAVLLVIRAIQSKRAHEAGIGPLGPPVLVGVVSAASILLGVFCFMYSTRGYRDPYPSGFLELPPGAVPVAPPGKPTKHRDDRAPWEFIVEATMGESPPREALDHVREYIWTTWSKAQALQSSDWNGDVGDLYMREDSMMLGRMAPDLRKKSAADRLLGIPLLPHDAAALGKFWIDRVRLGGWNGSEFASAIVRATDGSKTLRFTMTSYPVDNWRFTAAPVEIE